MQSVKAQSTVFTAIYILFLGVIVWALFGASMINTWGQEAITRFNLTGVAALTFAHLNLWIVVAMLVAFAMLASGGDR